ncbi:MAG TPA: glycosyltransferase family 9 protein [Pyrinomonadaceae bacterium]
MSRSYKSVARSFEWWLTHRALPLSGKPHAGPNGNRKSKAPIDLTKIERVLVVRLDEIGDVVLTTPFLRELRANLPNASITLLVKPDIRNLVELCPYVSEVITYQPPASKYWRSIQATSLAKRLARSHFLARQFDIAIVPRWDADSYYASMVTYLSGASTRVTYSEHVAQEKRRSNVGLDRLFTHVLNLAEQKHEVERNLDLIHFLRGEVADDRLEIWIGDEDEAFAEQFLRDHGVGPRDSIVTMAIGARYPRRVWPLARYVELGSWFKRNCDGFIVIIGNEDERHLGDEMSRVLGKRVLNSAGKTTLRQATALLKRSSLFVGNDTGPMHLAAAVNCPVIEISCHPEGGSTGHPNSPTRFGPWGVPHAILQPRTSLDSCFNACDSDKAHCITGVPVSRVAEVFSKLFNNRSQVA